MCKNNTANIIPIDGGADVPLLWSEQSKNILFPIYHTKCLREYNKTIIQIKGTLFVKEPDCIDFLSWNLFFKSWQNYWVNPGFRYSLYFFLKNELFATAANPAWNANILYRRPWVQIPAPCTAYTKKQLKSLCLCRLPGSLEWHSRLLALLSQFICYKHLQ